jgi:nucleotide-binding universal stress UspA family protein
MYQRIVVGTDGSGSADLAVAHAIELARLSGGVVHLVHAWDVSKAVASMGEDAPDDGHAMLAAVAEVCASNGVTAETHIVRDDPADALITVAHHVSADLLVVGNRGMTGAKRFVIGSVPNKISHHAPCNLLIIDTSSQHGHFRDSAAQG